MTVIPAYSGYNRQVNYIKIGNRRQVIGYREKLFQHYLLPLAHRLLPIIYLFIDINSFRRSSVVVITLVFA